MPEVRLDHVYRETHHWTDSVTWWENLGFRFVATWGEEPHRAGTLVASDATVVLAEVPATDQPGEALFLATDDLERIASAVGVDIVDTHWGTRMVSVVDPDGRTYNFEPSETTEPTNEHRGDR